MKYTEIIYLIVQTISTDEIGNKYYKTISKVKSYAHMQKVGSNEFYNATARGIKISYEFRLRLSNYNNELQIEYKNNIYDVIRTIPDKKNNEIVLVVGYKIGGINDQT